MSDTLRIVRPVGITDEMLKDCNVEPSKYDAWDVAATYQQGKRVYLASTHLVYQSTKDANTGNDPSDAGSAFWVVVGPTNRWAMFDASFSTLTKNPNKISFTVQPGQVVSTFSATSITDVERVEIKITSASAGGVVYDETFDIAGESIDAGWWQFFFGTRSIPNQLTVFNLPPSDDAVIEVTFTGRENLSVGTVLFGLYESFGIGISLGSRVGIRDYSRKETNEFGESLLVRRAYAHRMTIELMIPTYEVDGIQQFLSDIRATPVLWTATKRFTSMTFVGFYKNFEILIAYPNQALVELEIEGLP